MRCMRRFPTLSTLCLIFATLLAACGGTPPTATPTNVTSTAALPRQVPSPTTNGGTLTGAFDVGPGGSPQNFNPITQGAGFLWMEKYFSKLVVYDVGFIRIQGELAESWEISSDAQTFTFKLRRGVTWHDGQPFTAEDAKFSIDLFRNPESASPYAPKYADITEVAVLDPRTVVIKTSKPNAALLDAMTFVFMVPKHHLGSIAPKDIVKHTWWTTAPVGTGPFKWDRYVPDQYVELVANETYWRGKPKLDKLINRYFKEAGSALIALQRGEIQFVYVTADESEIVKKDPNLTLIPGPSQVDEFLQFNLKDPRFADLRVRQAFMYAIDRTAIVDQLFKGTAVVVPCVFDNKTYIPSSGLNDYKRDVAKAKALLQEANWASIKGEPIEMLTYYTDQLSNDILVTMQQQLEEVGITIKIRSVDVPTFNGLVSKPAPEFTTLLRGRGEWRGPGRNERLLPLDRPAARGFEPRLLRQRRSRQGLPGRSRRDRPGQARGVLRGVCKSLNADVPWAPMWVTTRFGAVSKKVGNFVYTPSAGSGKYYDQAELWTIER